MQLNSVNGESVELLPPQPSLLHDFARNPVCSKLRYDDALDTSAMKQVLLIDSNVIEFQNYVNASTFPIIYDRMCTREQMLEVLNKKFTNISRIAFVNHFSETPYFLTRSVDEAVDEVVNEWINQESLFSEENTQFLTDIITQFQVSNVDY